MARDGSRGGWLALLGLLGLLSVGVPVVGKLKTHSRRPVRRKEIEEQAKRWGPLFGTPVPTTMAISKIESGWKPDTVNWELRAIPLGGAWGPLQMTKKTAEDWARKLRGHHDARVRAVAARWRGRGQDLIDDLELAVLFSVAFLGALTKRFKSFPLVAAAYHQGRGKLDKMLQAGIKAADIPRKLPPKGKAYVAMAMKASGAGATA